MASEKKVILIFTPCDGAALMAAQSPALVKSCQKGTVLKNLVGADVKALAATGASVVTPGAENLWDAAKANDFVVGALDESFDMCVLEAGAAAADVEAVLASAQNVADRTTLIVVVARDAAIFHGNGFAKGHVVEAAMPAGCVAATVAYITDFAVPAACVAPIAYAALKDVNYKLKEVRRMRDEVKNMEAAMERKTRQPWDKHDCA